MSERGRELYREFTGWAAWVYLLLWGAVGGSAVAAAASGSPGIALLTMGSAALIHVVFGGLLVIVETDGVRVGLGRMRVFRAFLPLAEISELESVTYRPLRDFGGWGLRGSARKRVWSARGNRAVLLHMKDGRSVWIGSDEPNRLEGRIRNAMSVAGLAGGP